MDPSNGDLKAVENNYTVGDSDRTTILSVSNILRTLANDHQNNIVLRENALLRQEIERIRIELSELRMENLRIKTEIQEAGEVIIEQKNANLQISSEIPDTSRAIVEQKVENLELKLEKPDNSKAIEDQNMKKQQIASEIPDTIKAFQEQKKEKIQIKSEIPDTNKVVLISDTCDTNVINDINDKSNQELEQHFKKLLIQNIRNFLNYQDQKVVVNFKIFESIFSFLNDTDFMQDMKNFDVQFSDVLTNRFQFLYQNHILMMNQRIHQVEQQRRQKLFEHFRTGMQMENWAQRLEMQLASMKLISELRSVVLKLAAKRDRVALLQALQNLENKLKKDD